MRLFTLPIAILLCFFQTILSSTIPNTTLIANDIPFSTRAYWMRQANKALDELSGSPCPFAAFGTAIVNHTDTDGLGDLICIGVNQNRQTGNPSLHGTLSQTILSGFSIHCWWRLVPSRRNSSHHKLHGRSDWSTWSVSPNSLWSSSCVCRFNIVHQRWELSYGK